MVKRPKNIPTNPGVYIFRRGKMPLYVGKAANIRKRLVSYFRQRTSHSPKIQRMLREATHIAFEKTTSEVEALIREAELIKKFHPRYNVLMRDDKNYSFVGITKEPFPRIFVTHQPDKIRNSKLEALNKLKIQNSKYVSKFEFRALNFRYIGPFTSASELHATLKLLRRIFPYCTCRTLHRRPCLNAQIGRCLGYCCLSPQRSNGKLGGRARPPDAHAA